MDDKIGINILSEIHRQHAYLQEKENNNEEAEKNYLSAIALTNNLHSMVNLGIYYEEHNDYTKAIKYYMMAIDQYGDIDAMYNLGDLYKKIKNYEKMKEYLQMAINLGDDSGSMFSLGDYYENRANNIQMAIIYYTMAVDYSKHKQAMFRAAWYHDNISRDWEQAKSYYETLVTMHKHRPSMYNLAINYKEMDNIPMMLKYMHMAADEFSYVDSMYYLAEYYNSVSQPENTTKYYIMAIEIAKENVKYTFNMYKMIDAFTALRILKSVESPSQKIVNEIARISKSDKQIMIYQNKIALFTGLNHIVECGICYDEKLNINLNCGHCVCIDCYQRVYDKSCPFCRMD